MERTGKPTVGVLERGGRCCLLCGEAVGLRALGSFSLLCAKRLRGFGGVFGVAPGEPVSSSSSSVKRGDSIRFREDIISMSWVEGARRASGG